MRILLPPSETKRDGGTGAPLDLKVLSFPALSKARMKAVTAVSRLARDPDATMRALKLGPRLASEVTRNRLLRRSPTMAAIDRYTGVLFDALDAASLDADAREFARETVVVHSALFGLVGALDDIPAYRLSHDSRLPDLPLKAHWRAPLAAELARESGVIVDLRSEGYVDLGPAPVRDGSVFVRVVSIDEAGRRRALNHFNKRTKGLFTRALLDTRPQIDSVEQLIEWARTAGFGLETVPSHGADSTFELELVA
ncbi:YaaA family protein [Agromyces humatus]|uniref:Peroxide stress protein YaaA n=1 Tax=Agromyces humatus TaxID=279573 RepID=A0ABN2K5H9_9MICO|nr:peroxide stress protein YaaA [Agromyces humatus]